jgi:hypothetical protein
VATKVLAVTFDCHDPARVAEFWATALSYEVLHRGDEVEIADPSGVGPTLLFLQVPEAKAVKNRVHLDVGPDTSMEAEVERLVAVGASAGPIHQAPEYEEGWIWNVMQDPEGNEFCVCEPLSRRA